MSEVILTNLTNISKGNDDSFQDSFIEGTRLGWKFKKKACQKINAHTIANKPNGTYN